MEQLLAIIADRIAIHDWHYVCAHTGEDDEQPAFPTLIPRPGVDQPDTELPPSSPSEQVAFFSDM